MKERIFSQDSMGPKKKDQHLAKKEMNKWKKM